MPNYKYVKYLLTLLAVVLATGIQAESSTLRSMLLTEVDALFVEAKAEKAEILAPKNYGAALDAYKRAESRLEKGQSVDRVKKEVVSSMLSLNKAIEAAKVAQVSLGDSYQARQDALSSQADQFAKDEWKLGEDTFYLAAKTLEGGSVKRAQKYSQKAQEAYKASELTAIKANYLNETRRLLEEAKKGKLYKQAPTLISTAETNLNEAEKLLSENRYDTDEARYKAQQAKFQVLHANKISDMVLKLKNKVITPEKLILEYEGYIQDIGNNLDLNTHFHEGYERPLTDINNEIVSLAKDSEELVEARREITALKDEVRKLEGKLGIQSQKIAEQEAAKARLASVDALFSDQEAVVIMKAGNPIVRLIGLNFASGSAQIESQYFGLLKKVEQAIAEYPNRKFVIEGHTDSFGGDQANQELSQRRADSVREYLLANVGNLNADNIIATGYGENRPIASNENRQGRKRNRRIELRIIDKEY